jgi:hypothetical protein
MSDHTENWEVLEALKARFHEAIGNTPSATIGETLTAALTVVTDLVRSMPADSGRADAEAAIAVLKNIAALPALSRTTSADSLGLVEHLPLVGDRLLNEIASDPEVRAAYVREDIDLPDTIYALAKARLAAQERLGIAPEDRAFLYSTEVETLLTPVLSDMMADLTVCEKKGSNPGQKLPVLAVLRGLLKPYRELGRAVLLQALRDYPHERPYLDRLCEAAKAMAPAA